MVQGIRATPLHPLDDLTTAEYWAAYDVLQQAGHAGPDSFFASVLLHEPAKDVVLAWKPGATIPREADVVMLQKEKTSEARVDLAGRRLISWRGVKQVQAPFLSSEIFGADEMIKKDPRVLEALGHRRTRRAAGLRVSVAYAPVAAAWPDSHFSSCAPNRRVAAAKLRSTSARPQPNSR